MGKALALDYLPPPAEAAAVPWLARPLDRWAAPLARALALRTSAEPANPEEEAVVGRAWDLTVRGGRGGGVRVQGTSSSASLLASYVRAMRSHAAAPTPPFSSVSDRAQQGEPQPRHQVRPASASPREAARPAAPAAARAHRPARPRPRRRTRGGPAAHRRVGRAGECPALAACTAVLTSVTGSR